ncbi:hypothetical protein GDO81_005228 [Engystomops pustulosus]|uniref:Uncharacterized protein n=1 Tax=Engystomops pustulosus TaxID=76066 RepID=A0AAV7CML9_ENGPU|nr:hypothetical protein GDO81_005228 [Engystomops pustulosus]
MANQSTGPIKEQPPSPSNLTVENVTKLELEYESIDGERCKVEEYIRRNQLLAELQTIQLVTTEVQEQVLLKSTTSTDLWRHGDRNEEKTELSSKPCGNETPLKLEKMQTTNVTELTSKHAETQTECDEQYTANTSKNDGHPEPDDTETKISTSKAVEQGSVPCVNTVGIETTSLEHDDSETFGQLPLGDEDNLLDEVEYVYSICEFCHLPKKPFPSIGQLASEPSSMLFCCAKIQELFQYMIMDTIESYTPEKTAEETEDEQTAAHTSDEMKALCELREQIKKRDTKEYVDHLENHLNTYGSLFLMQKITFSLASSNDTSANHFQSNCAFSDQDHSIDNYFIPIMDSELIKKPTETTKQCYSTGQNFLLLLPDGTGQVLYPNFT